MYHLGVRGKYCRNISLVEFGGPWTPICVDCLRARSPYSALRCKHCNQYIVFLNAVKKLKYRGIIGYRKDIRHARWRQTRHIGRLNLIGGVNPTKPTYLPDPSENTEDLFIQFENVIYRLMTERNETKEQAIKTIIEHL